LESARCRWSPAPTRRRPRDPPARKLDEDARWDEKDLDALKRRLEQ
jgi:hypothetical protein